MGDSAREIKAENKRYETYDVTLPWKTIAEPGKGIRDSMPPPTAV
jgi:hypothetical protein